MKIKICCIKSADEARLAIRYGADAVGLVGEMPSGPGVIDDDKVRDIARTVAGTADTFLLTSRTTGPEIAEHVRYCATSTVQIVRHVEVSVHEYLREEIPGVRRVQVIHVEDDAALEAAGRYAPHADVLLLDSGRPGGAVEELGGTGRRHDWRISAKIVEASPVPVFLAGGLDPANVADAVRQVGAAGVDLCSGVRTGGRLDETKLARFVLAARS